MSQTSTRLWFCIVVVVLGLGFIAAACIASDPDLQGWQCKDTAECGDTSKYLCHEGICRIACGTGKSCTTNETCFAGLVCLPNPVQETSPPDGNPADITPESAVETTPESTVDATSPCKEGEQRPCFTIQETQRNKGICKDGLQTCVGGNWGKCIGEITPSSEICGDGLDNNCDGVIDETCDCKPGDTQPCGNGLGECKQGSQKCEGNGKWGPCDGGVSPVNEVCDGKDNNCNGQIDEDFKVGQACVEGLGACANSGLYVCDTTTGKARCDATPGQSGVESCNGIDDDCNGKVDDSFAKQGQACTVTGQQGDCAMGTWQCKSGLETCISNQAPTGKETLCDGKDDDCDGLIDEDFSNKGQACIVGMGACQQRGKWICDPTDPSKGLICDKKALKPTVTDDKICDGKDENCNGQIDEGCDCLPGSSRECFSGNIGCTQDVNAKWQCKGACKVGTQQCLSTMKWSACSNVIAPASEICDGKDNDCDGVIDNGAPGAGQTCNTGGKGECDKGKTVCRNGQIECDPLRPSVPEICDGKDNDCDGVVDNGNPGAGLPCKTGKPGVCVDGQTSCVGGAIVCTPGTPPTAEICDGKDNNCDGNVDEGNPGGGGNCQANADGICKAGKQQCQQGKLVCAPGAKMSETCNQLDDDCDGKIDNNLACLKGSGRCGGLGGQQKFACKSDCSGFQGGDYCDIIFAKEACYQGKCVKCGCTLGERRCDKNKPKEIFECKVRADGTCGFASVQTCSGQDQCRSSFGNEYCG